MLEFPEKELLAKALPHLLEVKTKNETPILSVAELRKNLNLNQAEYDQLFYWFFEMKIWKPIGDDWLEITRYVEDFESQFGLTHTDDIDFNLLHGFSNQRKHRDHLRRILPIILSWNKEEIPSLTIKSLLTFSNKTAEGKIVEAVGIPWFRIMEMIKKDPKIIYEIDPFKWEEIIAGAYESAGFDEVILTPRSGDKGRDVIATKTGIGSIRIIDQVKAYSPNNPVTANDVRAMAGVVSLEQNISKGVITTTSNFAPKVEEDELIKRVIPYRLELRPRDELLKWLKEIS